MRDLLGAAISAFAFLALASGCPGKAAQTGGADGSDDAGASDAGGATDAGGHDAGSGTPDAGAVDGGALDGGPGGATLLLCPNGGQTGNNANCVQPPALEFGRQGTGTSSAALTVSVNNCSTPDVAGCVGSGPVSLATAFASLSGPNAADFTVTNAGTCASGARLDAGATCTLVVRFQPSLPAGSSESAVLTVSSTAANGPQNLALSGASAAVTTVSSCQALSSGVSYQLTTDVSAPASCFTVSGSDVDLNLNGHVVTYCAASQTALAGGVVIDAFNVSGTTVHNGSLVEGAGPCTGLSPAGLFGSGAVIASSEGSTSSSSGTQLFNLSVTVKANRAKVLWEENAGTQSTAATVVHDVQFVDEDTGACNMVGCRAEDQYYPVVIDQSSHAGPSQIYNVAGTGSTQGGVMTEAPSSQLTHNFVAPGNLTATNTNGFIFQDWGPGTTIQDNLTRGAGSGGSCLSCRGVQVSSVASSAGVTGSVVQGNVLYTTNLNNDVEYGGCQIDGSYGMQLNTAGAAADLSDNTFQDNRVYVTSSVCPGFGFSWSGATDAAGPNRTLRNTFLCRLAAGATAGPCAGIRLDANEYSPHPDNAVIGTGDTYVGDTSAIYIWYDGTPSWTCNQCTFGRGLNAVAGYVMFDNDNGLASGGSSNPVYLVDPTFIGGATEDSNDLAMWAANNPAYSSSYTIQYTYSVTVQKSSSSAPIAGATLTVKDASGATVCSGSSDANGLYRCAVSATKYGASNATYAVTTFNPLSFSILAPGCTAANYSESVTGPTTEVRPLSGC
jgi:hypothetical protein